MAHSSTKSWDIAVLCFLFSEALLLIFASVAKFLDVTTNPFFDINNALPNSFWIFISIVEFAIALFLLSFGSRQSKLLLLLFLNLVFLVLNSWQTFFGNGNCNCLGRFEVPAWLMMTHAIFVVVFVVSYLVLNRYSISELKSDIHISNVTACVFGLVLGSIIISPAVSRFKKAQPIFPNQQIQLGKLSLGEDREVEVMIANKSNSDLKIVGSKTSCACVVGFNERGQVPARSVSSLRFEVLPSSVGDFHQRALIYVSHPSQQEIVIDFFGVVK